METHLAAEEIVGVEVAEQQVRVGDRRQRAACAVAGRPWIGARAVGADPQQAKRVDPGDAAAAGADLDQVDRWRLEKQAAALLETAHAGHLELRRARRLAAGDQRDLGGRAAHIESQDVGRAEPLGKMRGDRDASSGPGLDQPDRELAREIEAQRAAAGAHHEEGAARASFLQGLRELGQIARHQRLDVGIGHGGGNAAVLADLRQHARGQRHREIGPLRLDSACRGLLVGRVGVGVQEAHGDRLDVLGLQRAQGVANLGLRRVVSGRSRRSARAR